MAHNYDLGHTWMEAQIKESQEAAKQQSREHRARQRARKKNHNTMSFHQPTNKIGASLTKITFSTRMLIAFACALCWLFSGDSHRPTITKFLR